LFAYILPFSDKEITSLSKDEEAKVTVRAQ